MNRYQSTHRPGQQDLTLTNRRTERRRVRRSLAAIVRGCLPRLAVRR